MKKQVKVFLVVVLCILVFAVCALLVNWISSENGMEYETPPDDFTTTEHITEVETVQSETTEIETTTETITKKERTTQKSKSISLSTMTLEQKVAQLFIVRPEALNSDTGDSGTSSEEGVTQVNKKVRSMLKKYPVGGVCQFSKNIMSPAQIKKLNKDLQDACDIPMFITVDEEGGIVARLANNDNFDLPTYKSATAVGSSGNTEDAYDMGKTIGKYLTKYGFNMDFAPDADVNTNPNNPIIGTRAFSSNPKIAAKMVSAAAEGFRDSNILPTLKHFPGHGDTAEDSHTSLAVNNKTLKELKKCEFLTFKADKGIHAIMVGHIAVPKVTGNDTPATLSSEIIDLIPNKESTLIVTDSLEMQGVAAKYSSGPAAVKAFQAGCDVLLMPKSFVEAYDAVLEAVKDGTISEERLDVSVGKILTFKKQFVQ